MTTHDNKACCSLPVAEVDSYSPKGTYKNYQDTKCYVVGPSTAKKAIFFLYDVFGFRDQTIQGADILSSGGKTEYLVIMPDLFHGEPADPAWFADQEKHKDQIGAFMPKLGDPGSQITEINQILGEAKKTFPSVERWASIGYCWGGKLVALSSGSNTPWVAGVQTSPAKVSAEDAEKITIPMAMLASKDEPADDVKAFEAALKVPKMFATFDDQVHGWMSARGDLKNTDVKKAYEKGYQMSLDFFAEHL